MADSDFLLDSAIFALDRRAEIRVEINGTVLGGGIGEDGNITGIDVDFDLEQVPPTCALDVVTIPDWVLRGQDVLIYAGFDGQQTIVFKGKVKKRRHAVSGHTIDCVGRTGKLTRPYRSLAKSFLSTGARDAILDILNDSGVDFTEPLGEQIDIDAAINDFVLGTVQAAILELGPPSDMIRKIADVDGNRAFETRAGTLRIRPLLEAPATNPFRTYTTATGSDGSVDTTLTYSDANIDAAFALGNVAANTRRAQGFQVAAAGNVSSVSMWVRRVGSPTDNLLLRIHNDNGAGLPGAIELGGGSPTFNGQLLDTVSYTQITMGIPASTQLEIGTTYHVTIERDGALDAVNYYEVGTDDTAPGYADGVASVRNATTWSASGGGDGADHPFEVGVRGFGQARILGISDDEDEDQVKKSVVVRGASLPDVDAEGNEVQSQIQGVAITLSDDLVVGGYILDANGNIIGTYYEASYQNDLIQATDKANEVALRLLDKYHRVLDSIELEVPFDPRIDLGQTIALIDTAPPGVTNKTGNWWIRAYRHNLAAGAASTQLSLFGGDQSGTTGIIPPRADFTYRMERELVGNAIMVVVTFDASASTGKIVNYRWQDDYAGGALDVNGPDLARITRSYNPNVDSEVTVTLTVRDENNLASSVSHTITMTTSNEDAYAPVVSCAAGNTCMATFDGALSWSDIATPSGTAVVTAITYNPNTPDAPMVILFGTTTGRIYRSTDGMASLVLEYTDADGDAITNITPDIVRRGIIWATTTDRVLLSVNYGDTWAVYTDFNNSANWPRTTVTTVMAAAGIDASQPLGDNDTHLQWAAELDPTVTGQLGSASLWLRRVGTPADNVRVRLYSSASGAPDVLLATSNWIAGSTISAAGLVRVNFAINDNVQSSDNYHVVLERSGNPDGANHYLVATNNIGVSDFFGFPGVHDFDLDSGINSTQTTLTVVAGQGEDAPATPFFIKIDSEIMRVTTRNVDVFTIQRGVLNTVGAAHLAAADIFGPRWSAFTDLIVLEVSIVSGAGHVNPTPPDPRPINGVLVSDPSVNRIWVFGGHGDVPESWFSTNFLPAGGSRWHSEISQGDGSGAFPRPATETVTDAVVSHATSGDLGLVFTDPTGAAPSNPYIYSEKFYPVGTAAWSVGGGAMVGAAVDGVGAAANNNQLQIFGAVLNNKNFYVSGDGVGFWPLIDVLPGTVANRPHHLLNIAAWRDIYLSAMDEGIAKSVDFGRTWNFFRPQGAPINTTWPAGAIGWQVAIEYRRPRAFQVLASVFETTAGQTATMLRNGTGAWVRQSLDATAYPYCRIFSFPGYGNTLFRTRSTGSTFEGAWQTLQRSTDLGVTWVDAVVVNCADITRAANGDLYAIGTGGDAQTHRIYRSINQGVAWTEVFNDTFVGGDGKQRKYRRIEADPTNPNRVVACGWDRSPGNEARRVHLITLDATLGVGATWGPPLVFATTQRPEENDMAMAISQNGRILVAYESSIAAQVLVDYSDNDGLDWLNSLAFASSGNEPPRVMRPAGLHVYMLHAATGGIHRTVDDGLNWVSFTDIVTPVNARGLTYDGENDILYVGRAGQALPADLEQVQMMTPPTAGSVWIDVSAGITTASGFANHTRLCSDGLETFRG